MSSQIELVIDNRERELKTFFSNYSNVKFGNLDIGDIVFRYQGDIVVLIERKTIGDLISSIKDGRYGAYVTNGKINATLPKATPMDDITLEIAIQLIADKKAKGPVRKKYFKRKS